MRKRSNVEQQTIELEASNTPRFDIDGQRYGNTLTDDMIYLKNPRTKRGIDRHAPTSLPYFTRSDYDRNFALDNAEKYSHSASPTLSNNVNPMFSAPTFGEQKPSNNPIYHTYGMEGNINGANNHGFIGRKKNIDYSVSSEPYVTEEAGYFDGTDMEDLLGEYHKQLLEKKALDKALDDQSIREDVRYIKSGGRTKHSEGEQWLREDAEYDPAVDSLVNYKRLSPAQLELLLKMGVDRPESEDLMNYLHLYQFYLDNLKK